MNSSALATSLLGRHVRLHEPVPGTGERTGQIASVYLDGQGVHYVLFVAGRLVQADSPRPGKRNRPGTG
jgi:hypothetical protein